MTKNKKAKNKKATDLAVPQYEGKALSLVPTLLASKQILQIMQKTPAQHIYSRPAKGGGRWSYVTGVYVKKVLNYAFGFTWDFEVKEHGKEGGLVWVLGRLIIKDPKTLQPVIIKEQFGRADIKFKKDTKEMLDYGNDLKSATTDALKKCASELGIASDIYGQNEFRDIQQDDKKYTPPKDEVQIVGPKNVLVGVILPKEKAKKEVACINCATIITEAEAKYSQRFHKKNLCRDCQKLK